MEVIGTCLACLITIPIYRLKLLDKFTSKHTVLPSHKVIFVLFMKALKYIPWFCFILSTEVVLLLLVAITIIE